MYFPVTALVMFEEEHLTILQESFKLYITAH